MISYSFHGAISPITDIFQANHYLYSLTLSVLSGLPVYERNMTHSDAMDVDNIMSDPPDPLGQVAVTSEQGSTIVKTEATPVGQSQSMEIDSASVPQPGMDLGPELQAGMAVTRKDLEETGITAPFPPITPVSEVFLVPADVLPVNPSLNHQPTSSHPSDFQSTHPLADAAFPLTNGQIPRVSRKVYIPHPNGIVEPVPGPAQSSPGVHDVIQPSSPARMVRTGYVYDPLMMLHCKDGYTPTSDNVIDIAADGHPEEPMRIKRIFSRLAESGLIKRMKRIDFAQVTFDQVLLVHTADHWDKVQGTESKTCFTHDQQSLHKMGSTK